MLVIAGGSFFRILSRAAPLYGMDISLGKHAGVFEQSSARDPLRLSKVVKKVLDPGILKG